jgi:hypothetical protein
MCTRPARRAVTLRPSWDGSVTSYCNSHDRNRQDLISRFCPGTRSGSIGTSSLGIGSEHHIGNVDHRLDHSVEGDEGTVSPGAVNPKGDRPAAAGAVGRRVSRVVPVQVAWWTCYEFVKEFAGGQLAAARDPAARILHHRGAEITEKNTNTIEVIHRSRLVVHEPIRAQGAKGCVGMINQIYQISVIYINKLYNYIELY